MFKAVIEGGGVRWIKKTPECVGYGFEDCVDPGLRECISARCSILTLSGFYQENINMNNSP